MFCIVTALISLCAWRKPGAVCKLCLQSPGNWVLAESRDWLRSRILKITVIRLNAASNRMWSSYRMQSVSCFSFEIRWVFFVFGSCNASEYLWFVVATGWKESKNAPWIQRKCNEWVLSIDMTNMHCWRWFIPTWALACTYMLQTCQQISFNWKREWDGAFEHTQNVPHRSSNYVHNRSLMNKKNHGTH